eukprot:5512955-Pyramimonas_sp.AAC.1
MGQNREEHNEFLNSPLGQAMLLYRPKGFGDYSPKKRKQLPDDTCTLVESCMLRSMVRAAVPYRVMSRALRCDVIPYGVMLRMLDVARMLRPMVHAAQAAPGGDTRSGAQWHVHHDRSYKPKSSEPNLRFSDPGGVCTNQPMQNPPTDEDARHMSSPI